MQIADEAVGRVEVMVAQTGPLAVGCLDPSQRLVQRQVKIAGPMGQKVSGMQHEVGLGCIRQRGNVQQLGAIHFPTNMDVRQMGDPQPVESRGPVGQDEVSLLNPKIVSEFGTRQREEKRRSRAHQADLLHELTPLGGGQGVVLGLLRHEPCSPALRQLGQSSDNAKTGIDKHQNAIGAIPQCADPGDAGRVQERQRATGPGSQDLQRHNGIEHHSNYAEEHQRQGSRSQQPEAVGVQTVPGIREGHDGNRHHGDQIHRPPGNPQPHGSGSQEQKEVETDMPDVLGTKTGQGVKSSVDGHGDKGCSLLGNGTLQNKGAKPINCGLTVRWNQCGGIVLLNHRRASQSRPRP